MRTRTTLLAFLSVLLLATGQAGVATASVAPASAAPASVTTAGVAPADVAAARVGTTAGVPASLVSAADGRTRPDRPLPALAPVPGRLAEALAAGRISEAKLALLRAKQLLRGGTDRTLARGGGDAGATAATAGREATLALRDLALRLDRLSVEDRKVAGRLLARPTDGAADPTGSGYRTDSAAPACGPHVCVHWVTSTSDAPSPVDLNADGVPDWVEQTRDTFEHVWETTVGDYGYRAPKSDDASPNNGGDGRLDVYLADLGEQRLYGYCTSDDPEIPTRWDVSAYCVVDNDFATTQFGRAAPTTNLEVTAAHEFFHAVQFAYDWAEDLWLLEGSAAWVEDEIYDDADDNHQYLPASPLALPRSPLDYPGDLQDGNDMRRYGSWIFWRFLSEYFGSATQADRTVVRDVWRRADARPGGPDQYSLQAVRQVTARRGVAFPTVFADFGALNRVARRWYEEGESYPQAAVSRTFKLTRAAPSTRWRSATLHHLTSYHVKVRSGASLTGKRRLRVSLDLPNKARGARASLMLHRRDGSIRWLDVGLNRYGDGEATVAFSRRTISYVALTLTNAGTAYTCNRGTTLSCSGVPRDDKLRFFYRARAIR